MNEYYKICKFAKPQTKKKKKETVTDRTYYKVWNLCNGTCQLCGTRQSLELHHIRGRGKGLTNNYRNCVMLCTNCHHNIVHANLKKYRPILLKLVKEKYKDGTKEDV